MGRVDFVCKSNLRNAAHSPDPVGYTMLVETFANLLKVGDLLFTEREQCNEDKCL